MAFQWFKVICLPVREYVHRTKVFFSHNVMGILVMPVRTRLLVYVKMAITCVEIQKDLINSNLVGSKIRLKILNSRMEILQLNNMRNKIEIIVR